ncbi:MAG: polysaccharide deacetylase family protein [Desulfobacteraceae bacterium]
MKSFNSTNSTNPTILLTIDVEDWFQVENFKSCISYDSWSSRELRVERVTHVILDLLDSISRTPPNPTNSTNTVTFFILAWIAERLPGLVREIHSRGHEVASHGCTHELCSTQTPEALLDDLTRSKEILEARIGERVYGFRAPSFSISERILESIRDAGYLYDSSYNSFSLHGRYGRLPPIRSNRGATQTSALIQPIQGVYEIPISNVEISGRVIPWGGGAYFRLIPERLFRAGIRLILKRQNAYTMYLHPWEFDPDQPRVKEVPVTRKFRHYSNLGKTQNRLKNLITTFSHCSFVSCRDYIRQTQQTQQTQ